MVGRQVFILKIWVQFPLSLPNIKDRKMQGFLPGAILSGLILFTLYVLGAWCFEAKGICTYYDGTVKEIEK